jgi:hypothetical protein
LETTTTLCHSSAKLRTVKIDNFCDPVAAGCDRWITANGISKIDIRAGEAPRPEV